MARLLILFTEFKVTGLPLGEPVKRRLSPATGMLPENQLPPAFHELDPAPSVHVSVAAQPLVAEPAVRRMERASNFCVFIGRAMERSKTSEAAFLFAKD